MKLTGENRQLGEKPVPMPLCPPQISHGLDLGFFFVCSGFFPFDPFLYCLNPFVLHVTLRSILPSLYNKHNTNIHDPGGIRTHNPSKRVAAGPRLRPRGHWDRLWIETGPP
jgi:hypothetical protein